MNALRTRLFGTLILLLVAVIGPAEAATYQEFKRTCNWSDPTKCIPEFEDDLIGTFNYGVFVNGGYSLDTIWLRARVSGSTSGSWHELNKYGSGAMNDNAVWFSFDADWLKGKLGISDEVMKLGVDIQLKIKSSGLGSGLEDKCKVAQILWSSKNNNWVWRLKEKDQWHTPEVGVGTWFRSGGTVNNVSCRFVEVGGATASSPGS